ncbi:MAG: recombinase family protein [Anaerolineae bacterium]
MPAITPTTVFLGEMYLDDGVTSGVPFEERPGGKRLMADARDGKFNMVLAFRLDRVERTARRLLQLEYSCPDGCNTRAD